MYEILIRSDIIKVYLIKLRWRIHSFPHSRRFSFETKIIHSMDRVRNLSGNFFEFEAIPNGNGDAKKVDPSQRVLRLWYIENELICEMNFFRVRWKKWIEKNCISFDIHSIWVNNNAMCFSFCFICRRTRSLNAPSPFQQFGPCGRIMKNSAMVM